MAWPDTLNVGGTKLPSHCDRTKTPGIDFTTGSLGQGLGDAVASVLAENCPTPMKKLSIFESFGEVGSLEYLRERFHLNAGGVVEAVQEVLKMK